MSEDLRSRLGRIALRALDGADVAREIGALPPDVAPSVRTWFTLEAPAAEIDPAVTPAPARAASRFGDFERIRILGQGAQGVVYLAEEVRLGRKVALKVLDGADDLPPEAFARFRLEAEAAARLDHPGICPVYRAGEVGGTPYLAMRYFEAGSLAQRREASRAEGRRVLRLRPTEERPPEATPAGRPSTATASRAEAMAVVEAIEGVARALHAAHVAGIVHRDIKPGNLLLTEEGALVLADFGLARDANRGGATLTRPGALFGTSQYMSPEQVTRQAIRPDRRTDVFSLGVVLYECLTLELPFQGPTLAALYQAILAKEPRDPRRLNPAIPSDLRVVVETALQKDRDKRYLTAAALAEDLRAVRERRPIQAKAISRIGKAVRWTRREPWKAALAAAVFVFLPAVFGVGVYARESRDDAQRARLQAMRERVDRHVDEGFFDLYADDLDGARRGFHDALREDPRCVLAIAGLAHLEGDPARALRFVEAHAQGLEEDPDFVALHGLALGLAGRREESARTLARPIARSSATGHFFRGYLDHSTTPYNRAASRRAEEELRLAVLKSARPSFLFVSTWGKAAAFRTDKARVEQSARILLDLWGDRPEAWAHAAGMWEEVGEHDRAKELARRVLDRVPDHYGAVQTLMWAALHERDLAEAEAQALRASALRPDLWPAELCLARLALLGGRWEEAREGFHAVARRAPGDLTMAPYCLAYVAESLHMEGRSAEAVDLLEAAIRDHPRSGRLERHLAEVLLDLGRIDDALARVALALEVDPESPWAHYLRSRALLGTGDRDGALEAWEEARSLEPEYATAPPFLSAQQDGGDTLRGARTALDLGCELFPEDPEAHLAVARFLLHPFPLAIPGDAERAVAAVETAVALGAPEDSWREALERGLSRRRGANR